MNRTFFLIGFPRSATTALARILDTATNAEVFVEQAPRLRRASIDLLHGRVPDPKRVLREAKSAAIKQTLGRGMLYGDKNPCLLPFVRPLLELWDCRFLYITRDGRDCVTSLINWHRHKAHNIFSSPPDTEPGGVFGPEPDLWDYSRMRPRPGDPLAERWHELDRFEKCAWYWNAFNEEALRRFGELPPERWMRLDASGMDAQALEGVFSFLGLEGFDGEKIDTMLNRRINSVEDRTGNTGDFPGYAGWTEEQTRRFWHRARPMMRRLGYGAEPEQGDETPQEDQP